MYSAPSCRMAVNMKTRALMGKKQKSHNYRFPGVSVMFVMQGIFRILKIALHFFRCIQSAEVYLSRVSKLPLGLLLFCFIARRSQMCLSFLGF